jgi:hypothetical protein
MDQLTPEQQRALNDYANLMAELRTRIDSIPKFADPEISLPAPTRGEACFLQLRLVCEIVALGCLVAHGDLKEVKEARLQKAYEADFIIKRLERLHPDFFPVPHTVEVSQTPFAGRSAYHYTPRTDNFMTKDALLKLYRETGSVLHRGSLKALSLAPRNEEAMFDYIFDAHSKLINLTSGHHLMTRDRQIAIVCNIPALDEGDVHVALAIAMRQNSEGRDDLLILG